MGFGVKGNGAGMFLVASLILRSFDAGRLWPIHSSTAFRAASLLVSPFDPPSQTALLTPIASPGLCQDPLSPRGKDCFLLPLIFSRYQLEKNSL